jgi:hypothetical protein
LKTKSDQRQSGIVTKKLEQDEKQAKGARKARLAEQLRANLQRRKQQARSRRTGAADERPEGIAAADKPHAR